MNPLLLAALGSILRHLLSIVAGALVARGIWSQTEAAAYVAAGAAALLAISWSLWNKYRGRLRFLTALEADPSTSEEEIHDRVKLGVGAKLAVLLCVAGMVGVSACGGNVAPRLVATQDAVHDALASAHDSIEAVCKPGYLVDTCQKLNGVMAQALRAGRAYSSSVQSERLDGIGPLVEEIGRALAQIRDLPDSDLRERILADLRRAINAAFQGVQS